MAFGTLQLGETKEIRVNVGLGKLTGIAIDRFDPASLLSTTKARRDPSRQEPCYGVRR